MNLPWNRRRKERELDEELRSHLAMAVAERVARGETRHQAEYAARREFGNLGVVREVTRGMWGGAWGERLLQDLRYGVRALRRSPAFSLVAGITLALGIGATTAVFTVVHGVLLRPMPYADPERLVLLSSRPRGAAGPGGGLDDFQWVDVRRQARSFEQLGAASAQLVTLAGAGDPARIPAADVTSGYLKALRVHPTVGRAFTADDEAPGRDRIVLLGDAVWRERFSADPRVIGRGILLDGVPHTVVGVLPRGFAYPFDAQLWRPLDVRLSPNLSFMYAVLGRLRPGVTHEQAASELQTILTNVPRRAEDPPQSTVAQIIPLRASVVGDAEPALLVFAGAVGLVMLVACANVANLLLMRAASRRREMAVRSALGAGRRRLVRQLVTESALLWLVAGVAGAVLSIVGVRVLLALAPAGRIPRRDEIGVDPVALAFALGLSLVTGLAFGLVPAVRATGGQLRASLGASARGVSGRDGRVHGALVVAEVALALVLLASAGLVTESFLRMRRVELGFRPAGLATMTVDLPATTYGSAAAMQRFHGTMLERVRQLPGVGAAGAVNFSPLGGALIVGDFYLDAGRRPPKDLLVAKPAVSAGYFRTMGIRLLAGREFTEQDRAGGARVVIISRTVAERVWPGASAVGQRIAWGEHPGPNDWLTVIGVVDDVRQTRPDEPLQPAIYRPYRQFDQPFFLAHMTFVARATGAADPLLTGMRQVLREVDPDLPVASIGLMDATLRETVAEPLFQARLIGAFSIFAVLLAGIGIYGVVAYAVAERTHEIGIRVALGASRPRVIGMVLGRVVALLVPGMAMGIGGALASTRALSSLLFDVKPNDPVTLVAVAGLLGSVALVAGLVPARRASRVDPLVALRTGGA